MKVNVAFVATDRHVMDAYTAKTGKDLIRVNATAETRKHKALKLLRRGQKVYLVKAGEHEGKPYFEHLEGLAPNGHAPRTEPTPAFDDQAEADDLSLLYWLVVGNVLGRFNMLDASQQERLKPFVPGPAEMQDLATTLYIAKKRS